MYASMHFKSREHEGYLVGGSSVSLAADSSLCGGSPLAGFPRKASAEKGPP